MARHTYSVRYVHAISPRDTDTHADIMLDAEAFADRKTLGKALRDAGVLCAGARVDSYRADGKSTVHVFPRLPGSTTYWHCVTLTRTDLGSCSG